MANTPLLESAAVDLNRAVLDFMARCRREAVTPSAGTIAAGVAAMQDCRAQLVAIDPVSPLPNLPALVTTVTVVPTVGAVTAAGGGSHTLQLAAVSKDAATVVHSRPVTWTSSDVTKATVSAAGLVTGVAAGTPTVKATVDGVDSATITITVT